MEQDKIITAEEYVKSISKKAGAHILFTDGSQESEERKRKQDEEMYDWFRDFAKLHVQAALEAASNNVKLDVGHFLQSNDFSEVNIDKDSILNAYPLENIK